jgi:phage tail sheath protein FI
VVASDRRPAAQTGPALIPPTDPADPATLEDGVAPTPGDSDYAGDPVTRTGLLAFDPIQIQLVGVDTSDPEVIKGALAYCELRGDCMFVGSVPEATTVETAAEFAADLRGKKVYGAVYGPRIWMVDPTPGATAPRLVPATGHVMGIYARTEATRGIHKAPAGDEARVLGAIDVEYPLSDGDHTFLVRDGAVNGIRSLPGAGIVVDASRTLSSDTRWTYVNVRLLFNYVKASLRDGLRWVRQEPNKSDLWDAVKFGTVRPFLMGLWRQGAFGTGDPEDVFTIVCDETNNPPDEVDKGNFNLQVTFWPSKPAETIVVLVGQQPSGGAAAEA